MSNIIPAGLLAKLKVIIPDIEDLIDESQSDKFTENGRFSEVLFQKYLLDKKKAAIYRRVSDQVKSISSDLINDGQKSIMESIRGFGQLIWDDVSGLLDIEGQISRAIGEYAMERNRNNIQGLRDIVVSSVNEWKQKMNDTLVHAESQLEEINNEMIRRIQSFDASKVKQVRPFLQRLIIKLRRENKRAAEAMKKILGDNVAEILNRKIDGLEATKEITSRDLELTDQENKKLEDQIKKMIQTEVTKHRKIRQNLMNGLMSKVLNIQNTDELINKINDYDELSREDKDRLRDLVRSGYFDDEEFKEILERPGRTHNRDWIYRIGSSVDEIINDKRRRLDEIYNGKTWHVCNGGWWAALAHIGTLGFCSGYTLTAVIVESLELDVSKLSPLALIIKLIILIMSVPMLSGLINVPGAVGSMPGSIVGNWAKVNIGKR